MRRTTRIAALLFVLAISFVLVGNSVFASQTPYIQINNGDKISITRTEQPFIVLQFGAGRTAQSNIGILCAAFGDVQMTNRGNAGPFQGWTVAPAQLGAFANKAISFPRATNYVNNTGFLSIPAGQNFNATFQIKAWGQGGEIACAMVRANNINLLSPNLVNDVVANLIAGDTIKIEVR